MPRLHLSVRLGRLLLAAPLASCLAAPGGAPPEGRAAVSALPSAWLRHGGPAGTCGATADGRPLRIAERGIGGTGPLQPKSPAPQPGKPPPTGVAAIITGFGSVCLAGLEVGLASDLSVSMDGRPAAETALRAGQRATLTARWQEGRPMTGAIAVRHEVVGPIDSLGADGHIVVAGQPVRLVSGGWGDAPLRRGAWVAVSGLHEPDGIILASRIDPAPQGAVLLRGRLAGRPGDWRMGGLAIDLPGDSAAMTGPVVMRGRLRAGRLLVTYWHPDTLEANPAGYFGPDVHRYAIQALVVADGHALQSYDFKVKLPRNLPLPSAMVPALVGFERMGDSSVAATAVSPANAMGSGFGPGLGMADHQAAPAPQGSVSGNHAPRGAPGADGQRGDSGH